MHPRLAFVVLVMAVIAQALRVGGAQGDRLQAEAVEAVDQADIAGEHLQATMASSQVMAMMLRRALPVSLAARLPTSAMARRSTGWSAAALIGEADRMVQVTFQEQRFGARQAHPGDGTQFTVGLAHAKQLRHEVADIGASRAMRKRCWINASNSAR